MRCLFLRGDRSRIFFERKGLGIDPVNSRGGNGSDFLQIGSSDDGKGWSMWANIQEGKR